MCKRLAVCALISMAACAPTLKEEPTDGSAAVVSAVTTERDPAGYFSTLIAAVDSELWVYFSFDEAGEVFVLDSASSTDWDLKLSRFNIYVNGGISGPGRVRASIIDSASFDGLERAPASDYVTDSEDENGDGNPELVFRRPNSSSENGWFLYEPRFHTLQPADVTYVVQAMNGTFYKLEFLGYYDEFGEGGYIKFRWATVGAPLN